MEYITSWEETGLIQGESKGVRATVLRQLRRRFKDGAAASMQR